MGPCPWPLGRVVVAYSDGTSPPVQDVLEAVERVEARHRVDRDPLGDDLPEHPADDEPIQRQVFGLTADGLALGLTAVGRLAQLTPLPIEALSVVNVVDSVPRVRGMVERRLGPAAAER